MTEASFLILISSGIALISLIGIETLGKINKLSSELVRKEPLDML